MTPKIPPTARRVNAPGETKRGDRAGKLTNDVSWRPLPALPSRRVTALLLAFASGVPALVYEVVWTREVGLVAGSEVEAVATVLAAFFAGMAQGARVLRGGGRTGELPKTLM